MTKRLSKRNIELLRQAAAAERECGSSKLAVGIELLTEWHDAERFDLVDHLERQRSFSRKTFGPGARTKGIIDHIRKELVEIEADPTDLKEWVDVILLAFDGAWRAGYEPADIADAIAAKQRENESRSWPDWRTSDPDKAVEHHRTQEGV